MGTEGVSLGQKSRRPRRGGVCVALFTSAEPSSVGHALVSEARPRTVAAVLMTYLILVLDGAAQRGKNDALAFLQANEQ